MSQHFNSLKLKRVLAIYGCELKPSIKVGYLDVVAEDGVIIHHGTFEQIRERLGLFILAYGEPIIHPSAKPFCVSTPIIKASRQAREKSITIEIEEEKARIYAEQVQEDFANLPFPVEETRTDEAEDSGCEDEDPPALEGSEPAPPGVVEDVLDADFEREIITVPASADDESPSVLVGGGKPASSGIVEDVSGADSADEPEIRGHVVSPPPGFCLPDNRVGALEESCRPLGIFPTYTVSRRRDPATYYECEVSLGYFETKARGSSKRKAKRNAASLMLYKIADADPFVKPTEAYHTEVASGELITYNERYVPMGLENCRSPQAPRKATWAGVAHGIYAASFMPRLNRRQRRQREFGAKAIPQFQVDRWLEEPIAGEVWDRVGTK